jgi:hypothetical protein
MWAPSNTSFGLSISFRRILEGDTPVSGDEDIHVQGLPADAGVRWIKWRPSGGAVAFVVRPDRSSEQLELWHAEFDAAMPACGQSCVARRLSQLQGRTLQAVLGAPHRWTVDGRLLVKLVPQEHGDQPPTQPLRPTGPAIQSNLGTKKPARTYDTIHARGREGEGGRGRGRLREREGEGERAHGAGTHVHSSRPPSPPRFVTISCSGMP